MQNHKQLCKIYSRTRFSIFNSNKKVPVFNNKNKKLKLALFLIIFICLIFIIIWKAIDPIFESVCKSNAKAVANEIINQQSGKAVGNTQYEEMFSIQKDNEGKIQMISANTLKIDEISSNVAILVQKELNDSHRTEVKLPLGTFLGTKIFSGIGPNITLSISSVGSVEANIQSEFIEQSINQTLHRVYLNVVCQITVLTPYKTISENIENKVLLTENVILGEIPETYYNFNGIEGGDLLNSIQ